MPVALNVSAATKGAGKMASSQLAQRIKKTVDDEGYYDMEVASEAVDRYALQEVREVLTQLAEWPFPIGKPCWCHSGIDEHSEACQRARALFKRLEVVETQEGE
jgi:hypothetical protein